MLNLAIALSAILLVIWGYMISQQSLQTKPSNSERTAMADSTRDTRLDSLRLALGSDFPSKARAEEEASGSQGLLLTFFLLASAVGGLWWFTRKQNKQHQGAAQADFLQEIARQEVLPGQYVVVSRFNDEYWFLSGGQGSLQLMHRVPQHQIDEQLFQSQQKGQIPIGFSDFMQKMMGPKA